MQSTERFLVEAVRGYLQRAGGMPKKPDKDQEQNDHLVQHKHESLYDKFALKIVNLTHYDGICAAFRKIHDRMGIEANKSHGQWPPITDDRFKQAFQNEMNGQGIPTEEQEKALKVLDSGDWSEFDEGWHPDLDKIMRPEWTKDNESD